MAALGLTNGGPWLTGPDAAAGCHSGVLSTHIPRPATAAPQGKREETPILEGSGG